MSEKFSLITLGKTALLPPLLLWEEWTTRLKEG
jgi:hypothetical protein